MAKSPKNKTENVPANTNPETDAPLPTHVEYGDFKLAIADLSQKAAVYLLQYGFGKSLQDSVAGVRKEMTNAVKMGEDGKTPLLDEAGNTIPAHSEDEIKAAISKSMGERVQAIVDGTIGNRGPGKPKLTTRESLTEKVVREMLSAAAAKQNKKLPKIGEGYEALAEKFLAAKRDIVNAEVDHRMATVGESAEDFTF